MSREFIHWPYLSGKPTESMVVTEGNYHSGWDDYKICIVFDRTKCGESLKDSYKNRPIGLRLEQARKNFKRILGYAPRRKLATASV